MNLPRRFARARPRHTPGQMNRTEAAYMEHLTLRLRAGEIEAVYPFEGMKLLVSDPQEAARAFLFIDFVVQAKDGVLELHDVKGGPVEGDAWQKLKIVSERWPFRVYLARKVAKKDGGGWELEQV